MQVKNLPFSHTFYLYSEYNLEQNSIILCCKIIKRKDNEIMKKVKSIFKKALAMMGENEVKAWGIGIK